MDAVELKLVACILCYNNTYEDDQMINKLIHRVQEHVTDCFVIDNGSKQRVSSYANVSLRENIFIGGGIKHCLHLASEVNATHCLFVTNDVRFVDFTNFEMMLEVVQDPNVVQASAALFKQSDKTARYPWMEKFDSPGVRPVPHADFLCSVLNLSFISSFSGFPNSIGGWGYDLEMAYQAYIMNKKIVVVDEVVIIHVGHSPENNPILAKFKYNEMCRIYQDKYINSSSIINMSWYKRGGNLWK